MTDQPSNELLHRLLRKQRPMNKSWSGDIQIRKLQKPKLRPAKKPSQNLANQSVQLQPLKNLPRILMPIPRLAQRAESLQIVQEPEYSFASNMFKTFSHQELLNQSQIARGFSKSMQIVDESEEPFHQPTRDEYVSKSRIMNLSSYDFIQELKRHPSLGKEFWYANFTENVYEFELIPYLDRDPTNFLTISQKSITHMYYREATITSIKQWEKDYMIYSQIRDIHFFKVFHRQKVFNKWKRKRRYAYIRRTKALLEDKLLFWDSSLRSTVLKVRKVFRNLQSFQMIEIQSGSLRTLDEFKEYQKQKTIDCKYMLNREEDKIKNIVVKGLQSSEVEYCKKNGLEMSIAARKASKKSQLNKKERSSAYLWGDESRSKMPYLNNAAIKAQHTKLRKFTRLCDFLMMDTKVKLILCNVKYVQKSLWAGFGRKLRKWGKLISSVHSSQSTSALIRIMLTTDGKQIIYTPTWPEICAAISNSITKMTKVICKSRLLLHEPELRIYANKKIYRGIYQMEIHQYVTKKLAFRKKMRKIQNTLDWTFDTLISKTSVFEPYLITHAENIKQNFSYLNNAQAFVFESLLARFQRQIETFKTIQDDWSWSILQIDSSQLKDFLVPSAQNCIDQIYTFMPDLVYKLTDDLTKRVTKNYDRILRNPSDVSQYIEHTKNVKKWDEKLAKFREMLFTVTEIVELIQKHNIKLEKSVQQQYEDTKRKLKRFGRRFDFCLHCAAADKSNFRTLHIENCNEANRIAAYIEERLKDPMIAQVDSTPSIVVWYLKRFKYDVDQIAAQSKEYAIYEKYFKVGEFDCKVILSLQAQFSQVYNIWNAINQFQQQLVEWNTLQIWDVDLDSVNKDLKKYKGLVKRSRVLKEQGNYISDNLQAMLDGFQDVIPVISSLRDPALTNLHHSMIYKVLDRKVKVHGGWAVRIDITHEEMTVKYMFDNKFHEKKDQLIEIASQANKEQEILEQIESNIQKWDNVNLPIIRQHDAEDTIILDTLDDIMVMLDESRVEIANIAANRYVGECMDQLDIMVKKFDTFTHNIQAWEIVQLKWLCISHILSAADIKQQLISELNKFTIVDNAYKALMRRVHHHRNALEQMTRTGLSEELADLMTRLDSIQKQLDDYLDRKRKSFPRLFFLTNEELFHILSTIKNPSTIQPHLKKMFEGIHKLIFDGADIKAILSTEGERVALSPMLRAIGAVEDWLRHVEQDMIKTIRSKIDTAFVDYQVDPEPRAVWTQTHCSQVVSTVCHMRWCISTEVALLQLTREDPQAIEKWYKVNLEQLDELIRMFSTQLSDVNRRKLVALVTQEVHNRDIIQLIQEEGVTEVSDFKWQQQLRFYTDPDLQGCVIRQVNAEFHYGYEYLGATTRLVITPLTDKCWMTITGALHIKLGALPSGPAGTGKTESVKDLAKAMGRYCIVINGSDMLNSVMIEKLLSGLWATGSWTSLDEFNRIDAEVLSVIASQLMAIRNAKIGGKGEFYLEDRLAKLQQTTGIFATMNPSYIARTEMPDNLKAQFRPVSMISADLTRISEIMLFGCGFRKAKGLSSKMVKLFELSEQQLSAQPHYDFGLRMVKTVLIMAGNLKVTYPKKKEKVLLIQAMIEANVPKLTPEDEKLFDWFLIDLFPEVDIEMSDQEKLKEAIVNSLQETGLQPDPKQIGKIAQLYETIRVRTGIIIIGESNTGKSTSYEVLARTLTALRNEESKDPCHQAVDFKLLNPKSITIEEMYGFFETKNNTWQDGIVGRFVKDYTEQDDLNYKWIIFDGPIDSKYVENMNTVTDDTKRLCLGNSERIRLKEEMRIIYEADNLYACAPTTVSRCGVIYMEPEFLSWKFYVQSWMDSHISSWKPNTRTHLFSLFKRYIDPGLAFIKDMPSPFPLDPMSYVVNLCSLIWSWILPGTCQRLADDDFNFIKYLEKVFVFSTLWTLGGALDDKDCMMFELFLRKRTKSDLPHGYLYNYYVESSVICGTWQPWTKVMAGFEYKSDRGFFDLIVPTVNTVRFAQLLKYQIRVAKPVFITGRAGVGKSIIIDQALSVLQHYGHIFPINITFSAKTTSLVTQTQILSKLSGNRNNEYKSPTGNQTIVMIDDINMPELDSSKSQPPIELIRYLIDKGHIYDRKEWKRIEIANCVVVACASSQAGTQSWLTQRLTRHFHMLSIPTPNENSMTDIFTGIARGFFKKFNPAIQLLWANTVTATITLFLKLTAELLPTPMKMHYTFNLRDVGTVFQGILQANHKNIKDDDDVRQLWIHEVCRVFYDRLINQEDRDQFNVLCLKSLNKSFHVKYTFDELFKDSNIIFWHYAQPGHVIYEQISQVKNLQATAKHYLMEYNELNSMQMNLVFFHDALCHICRICRILTLSRGNAILAGVSGTGRTSLAKLSAFICSSKIYTIQVTKEYTLEDFHEDIKKIFKLSGGSAGGSTMFLLQDVQIVNDIFLEDINAILHCGEVINLYKTEEIEGIISDLTPVAQKYGVSGDLYAYFISRVRQNLHIVLPMSPVGGLMRTRMRMYPSLCNCCYINWIDPWPENALLSVWQDKMLDLHIEGIEPDKLKEIRQKQAELAVRVHQSAVHYSESFFNAIKRKVYISPKLYLDTISLFFTILKERKANLQQQKERYSKMVEVLDVTKSQVAKMQIELSILYPIMNEKTKTSEQLTITVEAETKEANKFKDIAEQEEQAIKATTITIQNVQKEADRDLAEAMPALLEAIKALDSINKQDISEIKSFIQPPKIVKFTLEVVCILLQENSEWEHIKKVVGATNFIDRLKKYDKDNISTKILKRFRKKIRNNSNYTPQKVATKSLASSSICKWTLAINEYAIAQENIAPKREHLKQMNKMMKQSKSQLAKTQKKLKEEMEKVAKWTQKLEEAQKESNELNEQVMAIKTKLKRASALTESLHHERDRWESEVKESDEQLEHVIGDSYIAAACIGYYGPFSGQWRIKMEMAWLDFAVQQDVQVSDKFSLTSICTDFLTIRDWNVQGLPNDDFSVNNGILVTKTEKWPLLIDPQEQGKKWIKNLEQDRNIDTIALNDRNFQATVERWVNNGTPLLLQDIGETLPLSLSHLVKKNFTDEGNGHFTVLIGESVVNFNKNFTLYLSTKIHNPHYLPDISVDVTLVNFIVTNKGLQEQLLSDVVSQEKPEMQQKLFQITQNLLSDQKTLRTVEDGVLSSIANLKGSILDNEDIIDQLTKSQELSFAITLRIREAEVQKGEIDITRHKYSAVATRGSILYFTISDLSIIDSVYQFSLNTFIRLFNDIVRTSVKTRNVEERKKILLDCITERIFTYVCRGLFNRHKTIFSFILASRVLQNKGLITPVEWKFLLTGAGMAQNHAMDVLNPSPDHFSANSWKRIVYLSNIWLKLKNPSICYQVREHLSPWIQWINSPEPQDIDFPPGCEKLTLWHKILLLKAFREEKIAFAIQKFVTDALGTKFVNFSTTRIKEAYRDMSPIVPMVVILSKGQDPTNEFISFSKYHDWYENLKIVSLGQGQGNRAKQLINQGIQKGYWVVLSNWHLYQSWMLELEKIVASFQSCEIHVEFRLFLTTHPCEFFPISILQNSIKITTEPPSGIVPKMIKYFGSITDKSLGECVRPQTYCRLMFGLWFFHSVVTERIKYGPLGWNVRYEFNVDDLDASIMMLRNFLNIESEEIPWEQTKHMIGVITYGGRVTDDMDLRLLTTILDIYVTPDIFTSGYTFSNSGRYHVPNMLPSAHQLQDYIDYINWLPRVDPPEIFGLSENSILSVQLQHTNEILQTALLMQPQDSEKGESATQKEEILLKTVDVLIASIPETITIQQSQSSNSVQSFFQIEIIRFNELIGYMQQSLDSLQRSVRGFVAMTPEMETIYVSVFNNTIPTMWHKKCYLTLKPLGRFVEDLGERIKFLKSLQNSRAPRSYWLGCFFYPQGFLTSIQQLYGREYQISIDKIHIEVELQQYSDKALIGKNKVDIDTSPAFRKYGRRTTVFQRGLPSHEYYIYGLHTQCCRWDFTNMQLQDTLPNELSSIAPIMLLKPNFIPNCQENVYSMPLYKTAARAESKIDAKHSANYIMSVACPTDKSSSHWIMCGAAFLCEIDT